MGGRHGVDRKALHNTTTSMAGETHAWGNGVHQWIERASYAPQANYISQQENKIRGMERCTTRYSLPIRSPLIGSECIHFNGKSDENTYVVSFASHD
jgi:hypothetical protein